MKKKNLVILLLVPFLIALLSIVTINMTFNLIDNDILSIEWNYNDIEGFKLSSTNYKLNAVGVSNSRYPVSMGNNLVWELENKDTDDPNIYAEIIEDGGQYYLKTHSEGTVIITCRNEKNTVYRYMTAVIYENGVILANPKISSSQTNVDPKIYYGEYDIENNELKDAKIELDIKTIPHNIKDMMEVKSITSNIEMSSDFNTIHILAPGSASVTLGFSEDGVAQDQIIEFEIVPDGVNVYTYDDLLYCTNKSSDGEVVVLRKSFESLSNACFTGSDGEVMTNDGKPVLKYNNVEIFGHYNPESNKFSFKDEIYSFETTFNHEFIDEWNSFVKTNDSYKLITSKVSAGLRVQKSFYGNGYTINMHNLTFPYGESQVNTSNGSQYIPMLEEDNLFRGPLPFYCLGDPNAMPLIMTYGQDNMGVYMDGDNILLNDAHIKNCDFGNTLANLDYVGNVIDIHGDNNSIINSRLQNGKNIVRSYSSNNLLISNSILRDARNFHIITGANEYEKIDDNKISNFIDLKGNSIKSSVKDYFKQGFNNESYADFILSQYLEIDTENKEDMKASLMAMNQALNDSIGIEDIYKGSMIVEDVLFYRSGIGSISIETLFNGPFLYSAVPSMVQELFGLLQSNGKSLIPLNAKNVSGISYPVSVSITGDTKFYDYKDINKMDISGLILENISQFANNLSDYSNLRKITIDDIFPIKKMLIEEARRLGYLYTITKDGETNTYINVPIAYYGGGKNLSIVNVDSKSNLSNILNNVYFDLVDSYLDLQSGTSDIKRMQNMILKLVTTAIGYEPFKFSIYNGNGYLFGETPQITDLKKNVKG